MHSHSASKQRPLRFPGCWVTIRKRSPSSARCKRPSRATACWRYWIPSMILDGSPRVAPGTLSAALDTSLYSLRPPESFMRSYPKSFAILNRNKRYIPGGIASVNRSVEPEIVFTKARGAHIWDAEGHVYLDYHAAFAPHILGHNHPAVTAAVERVLRDDASLFGSGTTELEGRLAELICRAVPFIDDGQLLNNGSESTYQAIRLARAITGRDHIIVMQGGYNGWHNDVSCNLMTPLEDLGPRLSPGEYPYLPISAGVPEEHRKLVHPLNFNDLRSVEYVCDK